MQLSSATHSQPCNLPPWQAYSNGTSRPQADASEIMSRIRLSSLKPSSQVSVTRTEREAVCAVHMGSLMPPTLTTSPCPLLLYPLGLSSCPFLTKGTHCPGFSWWTAVPAPLSQETVSLSLSLSAGNPPHHGPPPSNCPPSSQLAFHSALSSASTASPGSSHSWGDA